MIDLHPGALIGALIGAFAAGLAWVASELVMPRRFCPDCGAPFPKLYWPKNLRQGWYGGKTCKKCGCEVDRVGRKI